MIDSSRISTILSSGLAGLAGLLAMPAVSSGLTAQAQRYLDPVANGVSAVVTEPLTGHALAVNQLTTGPMTTHRWDSSAWVTVATTGPLSRVFQAMAGLPSGGVFLFGGQLPAGGNLPNNFTWNWDPTTNSWATVAVATSPSQRTGSAASQLPASGGNAILFGGMDAFSGAFLGDTWEYDGTNWTQRFPVTSPSPRFGAMMTSDAVGNVILFGGKDSSGYLSDTWQFDGVTWSLLAPATSPPGRTLGGLATDNEVTLPFSQPRSALVLSSGLGVGGTPLTDVWTFEAGNWVQQTALTGTIAAGLATGATDTVHRQAIFVGTGALAAFAVGRLGYTPYGFGCACPNNSVPLLTAPPTPPTIGQTVTYGIAGGMPSAVVAVTFGSAPAAIQVTPACNLWVTASGNIVVALDALGAGDFDVMIPNSTALTGMRMYNQMADPANTCGTNAIETSIAQ